MYEPSSNDELLTLKEAEERYEVKRSTLYRYIHRGTLSTYRRAMDKKVYLRSADLEALRRFRTSDERGRINADALERAREFQRRTFGDRVRSTPSPELIERARLGQNEPDIPWLADYARQDEAGTLRLHGDRAERDVSAEAAERVLQNADSAEAPKTQRARPGLPSRG